MNRSRALTVCVLVALGALAACDSAPDGNDRAAAGSIELVSVVDGDTIDVRIDGADETVRLIGINTPERNECWYEEASDALRGLLDDRELRLERDASDRDQYGRLLRYLYADDVFVNEALVRTGDAIARSYPPDVARDDQLAAAQQDARAAGAGLWAPDACGAPVDVQLHIADIEFDAPGDDNVNLNEEWVDVRNDGAEPVDVTGWVLKDESASHRYEFPAGFVLAAGASVRIHTGCGTDAPSELYWCVQGSAVWNNDGDTAFLVDPSGNIVANRGYATAEP